MGFIRRAFEWLFIRPSGKVGRRHPELYPIDTDAIKKEVRLEEEAESLGKANLPRSDATAITGTEAKLVQVIDRARQDYVSWGIDRLGVLNSTIGGLEVNPLVNRVEQVATEFEHQASALLEPTSATLKALSNSVISLRREVWTFKRLNQLERDAHYPVGATRFRMWAILIFLVVLEAAFNAFFFAQGIDHGLIGGFFYAFIFSFLNIFLGYVWGRHGLPFLAHVNYLKRLWGYASLVLAITTTVLVGLVIAHYREMLGLDVENAARNAILRLRENPLGLEEIHSWLLFGMSIIFAATAMVDAFKLDDPYPGYGKLTRQLEGMILDFEDEMRDVQLKLEALKEDALATIEKMERRSQDTLARLLEAIENKEATSTRLRTAFVDAERCLHALIHAFRNANEVHRKSAVPAYFNALPELEDLAIPSFDTTRDRRRYDAQTRAVRALNDRIPEIRSEILAAYNRRHDALQPLGDKFPSDDTSKNI